MGRINFKAMLEISLIRENFYFKLKTKNYLNERI